MRGEVGSRSMRGSVRVGKNAIARLSAQAWAKLLSLAMVPLVARYEGSTGLGRYVLVITIVGIVGALSDMGLNTFVMREAARMRDRAEQRAILARVLPLRLVLTAVGFGLVIALSSLPLFPTATRRLLPLGGLILLPEGAMRTMEALMNGRRRMDVSSGLEMVTRLLAVLGAVLALMLGFGVRGALISTVGATVLGALFCSAVLWRWDLWPRWQVDLAGWRVTLASAYPFALNGLIAMVYTRLDIVLLSAWQGEVAAGWYGAAYKLWEAFGLLPSSLLDALFPELARLASTRRGRVRLRTLFRGGTAALAVSGVALSGAGAALAGWLVPLLYGHGETYGPSVIAFRVLVWAIPAMFLYLLSGHTLYALERQRQVTGSMLIVGVANVGLNLWVIPRWSYLGVSGVALFSAWLLWALLYVQARRAVRDEVE